MDSSSSASSSDSSSSSSSSDEEIDVDARRETERHGSVTSSDSDVDDDNENDEDGDERDNEAVPRTFDDLPSDDSVEISSSDDESNDDENDAGGDGDEESDDDEEEQESEDDVAVGDRLRAKRNGLASESRPSGQGVGGSRASNKAEARRKALSVASERLAAMKKKRKRGGEVSFEGVGTKKRKEERSEDFYKKGDDSTSDGDEDEQEEAPSKRSIAEERGSSKTKKKRKKSKHRPTEASSKRSDFYARGAPDLNSSGIGVSVGSNKYRAADPRFQSLSGHLDKDVFEKKYSFLEDQQREEMERLKARVAAWKRTGRGGQRARRKLGLTDGVASFEEDQAELNRLTQTLAERRKSQIQRAAKQSVKRKIREETEKGHRGAYYLKRSEKRRLEVEAEFEELRKRGGEGAVDKAIAKRRKRREAKDKRFLPRTS